MNGIWTAKVRTPLRVVEVEVLSAPCEAASVRALHGAPFEIRPSHAGAPVLMSDLTSVRKDELIDLTFEELPDPVEDQAENDAYLAWLDENNLTPDDTTDVARQSCHW